MPPPKRRDRSRADRRPPSQRSSIARLPCSGRRRGIRRARSSPFLAPRTYGAICPRASPQTNPSTTAGSSLAKDRPPASTGAAPLGPPGKSRAPRAATILTVAAVIRLSELEPDPRCFVAHAATQRRLLLGAAEDREQKRGRPEPARLDGSVFVEPAPRPASSETSASARLLATNLQPPDARLWQRAGAGPRWGRNPALVPSRDFRNRKMG